MFDSQGTEYINTNLFLPCHCGIVHLFENHPLLNGWFYWLLGWLPHCSFASHAYHHLRALSRSEAPCKSGSSSVVELIGSRGALGSWAWVKDWSTLPLATTDSISPLFPFSLCSPSPLVTSESLSLYLEGSLSHDDATARVGVSIQGVVGMR